MQGMLLIDKPTGWTSFDVVNYIRKIVAQAEGKKPKNVKVGHTGTLDPFATGLLVILVGKEYTKRAAEFSKLDKTYEVTMRLGATSTTGDPEGEITQVSDLVPNKVDIEPILNQYIGTIQQVPPAYSAIKVNGQRAYKLARAGKEVKIVPRRVKINRLELVNYNYPEVKLIADVSSGTYIRTLIEDIGKDLGTDAYTNELRRIKIGQFNLSEAKHVKELTAEQIYDSLSLL